MFFFVFKGVVEIICHLLQTILFMQIILQCELRKGSKYYGIILCAILGNFFVGMQGDNRILYLLILLLNNVIIIVFFFKGNFLKNGMIYLASEFGWFVVDSFFSMVLSFEKESRLLIKWEWSWVSIVIELFKITFILLIGSYLKNIKKEGMRSKVVKRMPLCYYIILASFLFFSYVTVITVKISDGLKGNKDLNQVIVASVGILCLIFLVNGCIMILLNASCSFFQEQSQLKDEYLHVQNQFYNEIYEGDLEMRRFRHDMYAHMDSMRILLFDKKYKELEEYMITFYNRVQRTIRQKINSNNEMVDAILNHLISKGEEEGIPIYLLGNFPEEISVHSYDLCSILSNSISNALEACKTIPVERKRHIEVGVKKFRQNLFISVENTVLAPVEISILGNGTTKKDAKNHGFGISTMVSAVKRYGGDIEFKNKEDTFAVEILLYDVIIENESW